MYEPIDKSVKGLLLVRILMTVCVGEFFGPWMRSNFFEFWLTTARVRAILRKNVQPCLSGAV